MSNLPLDLERRFEQRWATARFSRPLPSAMSQKHEREKRVQQFAEPERAKMKAGLAEAAGLKSVAAVCEREA